MEYSACKPEIGRGLARNSNHKAVFGFFDHTGSHTLEGAVVSGIPRQECVAQHGTIVPSVDIGERDRHGIDIIPPPTIVKVDDMHGLTVAKKFHLPIGMDKPHTMAALLHRLARRLDPRRGDGTHGEVAWGVHCYRGLEAVPPCQHITQTRPPREWRMLGSDKRRRVLVYAGHTRPNTFQVWWRQGLRPTFPSDPGHQHTLPGPRSVWGADLLDECPITRWDGLGYDQGRVAPERQQPLQFFGHRLGTVPPWRTQAQSIFGTVARPSWLQQGLRSAAGHRDVEDRIRRVRHQGERHPLEVVACQDTLCQGDQMTETGDVTDHSTCRAPNEGTVNFVGEESLNKALI